MFSQDDLFSAWMKLENAEIALRQDPKNKFKQQSVDIFFKVYVYMVEMSQ
jgi:hypothetical protein